SRKVNLTVGLYYDDEGKIPVLEVVADAEQRLASQVRPRAYLPIEGLETYRQGVQELLFGKDHPLVQAGRVATIQTVGGTGALRVGADFLHRAYPDAQVWMSDPAWENHHSIFQSAGIPTHSYPYHDPATQSVAFDRMLAEISGLAPHSIVLLHACCHNPTGVDLSTEQWATLIDTMARRQLIPFLDLAYQGFGEGLEEDTVAVRALADAGVSFLVANSFSKNLSFYSERCGGLSVVCQTRDEADKVMGQLKSIARATYSTPPSHGGAVIATVLSDTELRQRWEQEVADMRNRILGLRQQVHEQLSARLPEYDSSYFVRQKGMFTYTGLSDAQLQALMDEHGVYIIKSGRISVPGLNSSNIDYFCDSMTAVVGHSRTV
ncbi:MAG TPA: amino acid aminotransferase, partial [Burkholderiaceae bacterium]|nr:amino acid aminotransferase [Burkholderiaceae bacterium]